MNLRFCEQEDLLRYEPDLDQMWPRQKTDGTAFRNWNTQIAIAMEEIDIRLRNQKDVPEQFELGRLGLRTKNQLKACAANYTLHFIFQAADSQSNSDGFFARKAAYYWQRANDLFEAAIITMDYDLDNDGVISDYEKNLPFPARVIRA